MNRIRLLPEQVANQIAAGEVIERPASVVKELVENALDADAHRISVTTRGGGRTLIRVTDDGWGMSRDDALLALERHATSKITKAEDLASIRSLGFRGEAVPSIAAVSRFTLTSRERGAASGTEIEMAGGKILSVKDAGTAEGTTVEVRSLFFNLPARRKFLRTEPTENAHIEHIVTLCALGHPAVAFRLVMEEREVFNLAPVTRLIDRLRELHGADICEQLVPVGFQGAAAKIHGFIGKPGISRSDRSQQHVFVNGRPVESRGIGYALQEGYHTALMKGRFPVTFLFVDIDPELVDVNIHPAKREVRFREEFAVRQAVIQAVRAALEPQAGVIRPVGIGGVTQAIAVTTSRGGEPVGPPLELRGETVAAVAQQTTFVPLEQVVTSAPGGATIVTEEEGTWRILGVVGRLYVLAESPGGLVLMDQHAAHERVLFEKMLRDLESANAPSQKLLLPVTLEVDVRDAVFLTSNVATLQKLGIGISEFGDKTFLVDALPPYLPVENLSQTMRLIVDELRQTGEQVHSRRLGEDKIATTVCRHAVKARDPLKGEELRALLEQLHRCDLPYTCPHGRPTMIQISYQELEKKFGRKV
jgi:DNA mismatch repair protein MutL